ncbi:phospho-sugar mutase [Clostridium aminobutyricum]|uniref:Phosphoglucomutase n=1 Tax=Clostridium aminobutyricum TaxID=33953 RepID=A0A939IJZ8_CLOAM|nr:phospho-sugar mutase [Clostridium aminobutyricum]MBN7774118.1 phospho-sugar mutase [Clostridium aminobutyricum]
MIRNKDYNIWTSSLREAIQESKTQEEVQTNQQLLDELLYIASLENAEDEVEDRFYKQLEFGTGGLRGLLGTGSNRINIYTVEKATQGIADYISAGEYRDYSLLPDKAVKGRPSVAIAYDSRINSKLFADTAARTLMRNGIDVYQYQELMPTPALSFAVRRFGCAMGIMITASHNPAAYNGYKVYDNTGCQITLEAAEKILSRIEQVPFFRGFSRSEKPEGSLTPIEESIIEEYLDAVQRESVLQDETGREILKKLSVVYTPLNGAGNKPVRSILDRMGISHVHIVKEQERPDGSFPTCPYPNPEKKEALALGLELCGHLAAEAKAGGHVEEIPDLLLATDPDCDRVGIAVCCNKETMPEYQLITGNELGVLLLDFMITMKVKTGRKKNPIAVKTIVSTKMADAIAAKHGVRMAVTLTGFKFIGEYIAQLEKAHQEEDYLFGFEESYGYLSGTYVRDKDAVNASMLICEMTAYYKSKGLTLTDRLSELYEEYGYYKNDLIDFYFEGARGIGAMEGILSFFRSQMPEKVAGKKVVEITDYQTQKRVCLDGAACTGSTEATGLPPSNVIEACLEEDCSFTVRPSGTEPKLKIYLSAKGKTEAESKALIEKIKEELTQIVNSK